MAIGIRELKNQATQILRSIQEKGSAVVVTRHGRPAALILPIDSAEAEDYVLAHAPQIVRSLNQADQDLRKHDTIKLQTYRRSRGL